MKENLNMTSEEVRRIAREEANIAIKETVKELETVVNKNTEILKRLERLLLGEEGVNEDDTLKARATYAYAYAKRNTDLRIIEDARPALAWFKDMKAVEPGCKESKLESLGKIITFYVNIRWFLAVLGITTVVNAIPAINMIVKFLENIGN